jgi:dCMP deaminase
MGIAEAVALRSHDEETKVGAILVKNDTGMVVATGHNGFVRGAPDSTLPKTRPEKYKFMVHAEENLLAHTSRNGINVDNCTLVITLSPCQKCLRLMWQAGITDSPCQKCLRLMWQAGITEVICRDIYRDHTIDMEDIDIVQTETKEGYHRLKYVISENERTSIMGSIWSYFKQIWNSFTP